MKALLLLVFVLIALVISTQDMLLPTKVTADYDNYHKQAIGNYSVGDFRYFTKYPALFHFLFVPLAWVNLLDYIKLLEPVFYTLSIGASVWLAYRLEGFKIALLVGLVLITSIGFLDRGAQINPEAMELFIFPIVVIAYKSGHKLSMAVGLIFLAYLHTLGFVFTLILLLHTILSRHRDKFKTLFMVLILITPSFYWLPIRGVDPSLNQNAFINPIIAIAYTSLIAFLLVIPIGFAGLLIKKPKITSNQLLYFIWFLALTPLGILLIDRWTQYMILPLTLFFAVYAKEVLP